MRRLNGRAAIISGAAQGIGFAIAKRLCDEGCRVGILDINEEKLCQQRSKNVVFQRLKNA